MRVGVISEACLSCLLCLLFLAARSRSIRVASDGPIGWRSSGPWQAVASERSKPVFFSKVKKRMVHMAAMGNGAMKVLPVRAPRRIRVRPEQMGRAVAHRLSMATLVEMEV